MIEYTEAISVPKGDRFFVCPKCRKTFFVRAFNKKGQFESMSVKHCAFCGEPLSKEMVLDEFQKLIGEK